MPDEVFSASTGRLRYAAGNLDGYAEYARAIVEAFQAGIAPTRAWPGVDDELAKQMRPMERQETETAISTGTHLHGAVESIRRGVSVTAQAITNQLEDSVDAVNDRTNQQRNRLR
ncbi:hypothetical protein [Streptomyces sp. NPDC059862]|uniref:hypothetical protein n=1 Tax=unclassified Streptomyces TaxID=2593676 RepID=UPI00362A7832